jgi:hypothetical protein
MQEIRAPRAHVLLRRSLTSTLVRAEQHAFQESRRLATSQTVAGMTQNFIVYTDGTPDGDAAAQAVLATCEADYAAVQSWFGGITLPPGQDGDDQTTPRTAQPMYVLMDPNAGGAYHYGCDATDIYIEPSPPDAASGLVVAEVVEIFEAAITNGWDCGYTNGEALSRVLAVARSSTLTSIIGQTVQGWWANGAQDYVNDNSADDQNQDANGCGSLFLYYLNSQLGFTWTQIATTGGSTLGTCYQALTGQDPTQGFSDFVNLLSTLDQGGQLALPASGNPFPIQGNSSSGDQPSQSSQQELSGLPSLFEPQGADIVVEEFDVLAVPAGEGDAPAVFVEELDVLAVPTSSAVVEELDVLAVPTDEMGAATGASGFRTPTSVAAPRAHVLMRRTTLGRLVRAKEHAFQQSVHLSTSQTVAGRTTHFVVYTDGTADGNAAARAVLASCEADFSAVQGWFGGIALPAGQDGDDQNTPRTAQPNYVLMDPNAGGAYHYACNATDLYIEPAPTNQASGLMVAEVVEVFEAAIANGWDCGHTNGEALSRVLAVARNSTLAPLIAETAQGWWANGQQDYVNDNSADDQNQDANGCGSLFLYYLNSQLGYTWTQIATTGGSSLGALYQKLTGKDPSQGFQDIVNLLSGQAQGGQLNLPSSGNPFPIGQSAQPGQGGSSPGGTAPGGSPAPGSAAPTGGQGAVGAVVAVVVIVAIVVVILILSGTIKV